MIVSDILRAKDTTVYRVGDATTLHAAAVILAERRVGTLVVENAAGDAVGLLGEREIAVALAHHAGHAAMLLVADAMTPLAYVATPGDSVFAVVGQATERRTRHIPIVDGNALVGIVSIGDLLKARVTEKAEENQVLQDIARWSLAV